MRPTSQLRVLPHRPGVYRLRDGRGRVRYIGRAADLRERVSSYWSDLGDRRRLRRMVAAVDRIEAVVCASRHDLAVDRGVRSYGPYLGGLQVKRALSGLERVLPLGYTPTGLSAAGLGMARTRSVVPEDRPRLAAELDRVLSGDVAAADRARAQLTESRDNAAAVRAYELAGRITEEIAALEWVCSEQRVNRPDAGDHLVHGWSDGMSVGYRIVAGRLIGWDQRRCSADEAAGPVARTRPEWRTFAARNAELAAALQAAGESG